MRYLSLWREKLRKALDEPSTRDLVKELEAVVQEILEKHKPISIILAGSAAKSRFVRGLSDIDLLVITEESPSKENRFVLKAVEDVDVEVTVFSLEEVLENVDKNPFVADAIQSGCEIHGNLLETLRKQAKLP